MYVHTYVCLYIIYECVKAYPVCMYVYCVDSIYIYVCVCVYIYMYTHTSLQHISTCIHIYDSHIYVYTYVCMYILVYVCV